MSKNIEITTIGREYVGKNTERTRVTTAYGQNTKPINLTTSLKIRATELLFKNQGFCGLWSTTQQTNFLALFSYLANRFFWKYIVDS